MEAAVQSLSSPIPGEEPFIGDGLENEAVFNSADGRMWIFNSERVPIELGGACVNKPINQNLFSGNYLDLDVTNPDNLPIPIPDPQNIEPGYYREIRILMRFVGTPSQTLVTYFDYDVDWGVGSEPSDYTESGTVLLVELCSFGPSPKWLGRIVWRTFPD